MPLLTRPPPPTGPGHIRKDEETGPEREGRAAGRNQQPCLQEVTIPQAPPKKIRLNSIGMDNKAVAFGLWTKRVSPFSLSQLPDRGREEEAGGSYRPAGGGPGGGTPQHRHGQRPLEEERSAGNVFFDWSGGW